MTLVSNSVKFSLKITVGCPIIIHCDIAAAQPPFEIRKYHSSLKEMIYQPYTTQENA